MNLIAMSTMGYDARWRSLSHGIVLISSKHQQIRTELHQKLEEEFRLITD
ncbi:MAG: hypothetical protein V7K25_03505 [Nostoc sp.]